MHAQAQSREDSVVARCHARWAHDHFEHHSPAMEAWWTSVLARVCANIRNVAASRPSFAQLSATPIVHFVIVHASSKLELQRCTDPKNLGLVAACVSNGCV